MIETGRNICKRFHTYLRIDSYRGRVTAVFPQSVSVETPFGMITLLDGAQPLRPFSCTINPMKPFTALSIREGDEVFLEQETILIPSAEFGVDVSVASDIELSIGVMVNLFIPVDMSIRLRQLLRVIESCSIDEDLSPLVLVKRTNNVCQMVEQPITALRAALTEQDLDACIDASAKLAGFGIGQIPSSDSFFAGYLAGYAALSLALGRSNKRILAFTREMARAAASQTNEMSAALILQSGEGMVSEDVFQLLRCLFSDIAYTNLSAYATGIAHAQDSAGVDLLVGVYLSVMHYYGEIEEATL